MGRRKKLMPETKRKQECYLGGIPMKVVNGKIVYASNRWCWHRSNTDNPIHVKATFPTMPVDSFVRRHIYNMRFNIIDEDEDERRKREYKEWWEKQQNKKKDKGKV